MDIDLLPGGGERRSEVRRYLADHAGSGGPEGLEDLLAAAPGYDVGLWAALAGRGWLRCPPLDDLVVVLEELGRARVPTPVQNGVVQTAAALTGQGGDGSGRLAEVLAGGRRHALCLSGPSGSFAPDDLGVTCRRAGAGYRLDGVARFVPYADSADVLLVAAAGPDDLGCSLVEVSPDARGLSIVASPSIAGDRQAEVGLENVTVAAAAIIGRRRRSPTGTGAGHRGRLRRTGRRDGRRHRRPHRADRRPRQRPAPVRRQHRFAAGRATSLRRHGPRPCRRARIGRRGGPSPR